MSVYKRGKVCWYKFTINGQLIRESAKTNSRTMARAAELARRRELEQAYNHIPKRERVPLFSHAADIWTAGKTGLAVKTTERYAQCAQHLKEVFAKRLVCDIHAGDIAEYQRKRLADGVSNRTVNYEVGTLRGILRQFGLWGPIADRVRALRERHDVGRALSAPDEIKLIAAASASRSPAILPLLLVSLDTGMRTSEVQALRYRDLKLTRVNENIVSGEVIVVKSKTAAGTGRLIPLTRRVCACLSLWLSRFPVCGSGSFVFPYHRVGIGGDSRIVEVYDVDFDRPLGSWRKAWIGACNAAGVHYRWHDLRHTFISRLAESASVSEQTIRSLAGHVSNQMFQRYSHIRSQAKQAAIHTLEHGANAEISQERGHGIGHSLEARNERPKAKLLETNGGPARI